ncbi:metalloregulator ArsR/SmtB family transcription factor, partial [Ferroplasma sp.]|uniref:ArsR/SmtB family transcription factor n=1 Tax=Ferroplasma sp. TaxID=2591003 RepID=UPI00307FB51D
MIESKSNIANIIHAISNPNRMKIIEFLSSGPSSVNKICESLNLIQPEVSNCLSVLSKNKIVGTNSIGREHVYYLYPEQLEPLLLWIDNVFSGNKKVKTNKDSKQNLNNARSCYDHLAGVNGVYLLEKMLEYKWLEVKESKKPIYSLTGIGKMELQKRKVKIPVEFKGKRIFAYGCMDWT